MKRIMSDLLLTVAFLVLAGGFSYLIVCTDFGLYFCVGLLFLPIVALVVATVASYAKED